MKTRNAEMLLALSLVLKGTSLLFSKLALQTTGPLMLLGYRFMIAFIFVTILFNKRILKVTAKELSHSAILGLAYVFAAGLELVGLKTVASSTTGFLENAVVIFVPILVAIFFRKLPDRITVLSALIAIAGLTLLTFKGVHLNFTMGELLILLSAVAFSFVILCTDIYSKKDDPFVLSVFQLFFIGLYAVVGMFIFEKPSIPSSSVEWSAIVWLGIVCTGIAFTLQLFGQKYTSADRAGLFSALNPIVAAVLGIIFLHEDFSVIGVIGSILVLIAVTLPSIVNLLHKDSSGETGQAVNHH